MGFASFPNTGDSARPKLAGTAESCARIDGPCVVSNGGPVSVSFADPSAPDGSPTVLLAGEQVSLASGEQADVWINGSAEARLHIERGAPGDGIPYVEPEPAAEPEPEPEPDRKVLVVDGGQSRYVPDDELVEQAAAKKSRRKASK